VLQASRLEIKTPTGAIMSTILPLS